MRQATSVCACVLGSWLATLMIFTSVAAAQVVIDMPPPATPRARVQPTPIPNHPVATAETLARQGEVSSDSGPMFPVERADAQGDASRRRSELVPAFVSASGSALSSGAAPSSSAPPTVIISSSTPLQPDVGAVALARYAHDRAGTYDTYFNDGAYHNGIRVYSYPRYFPQFIWGPFFGGHIHGFGHSCW